ncbi:hypothetical protein PQR46_18650 [Paraburkholderia sediminicola]|uniref:hypothetical protein n=1 Tax=Paraburkholderia sediminicola TaxID=458836 RepID=UPI0038B9E38A
MTSADALSCGCLVGLVANTRLSKLYDGLTLAEHAARSGISQSTLYKRVRRYGEPFPPHQSDELRVLEQDTENNKRTASRRIGRAAAHHTLGNERRGPTSADVLPERVTDRSADERASDEYMAAWMARAGEQKMERVREEVSPAPQPADEPDGHDVLWRGLTLGEWSRLSGETVRTLFVRLLITGRPFPERLS